MARKKLSQSTGELWQEIGNIKESIACLPKLKRDMAMIMVKIDLLAEAWNAAHSKQRDTETLKLCDEQREYVPSNDSMLLGRKISPKSFGRETYEVNEAVAVESLNLKHSIEDDCADSRTPLPNVTSKTLSKVIEYRKKHVDSARSENHASTTDEDLKAQDHELDEEEGQQEDTAQREEEKLALLQPIGPGPSVRAKWANRTRLNSPSFLSTQLSSKPRPTVVFFSNDKRSAASQPIPITIGVFVSGLADHTRCKTPSEMKKRRCSEMTERPYRRRLLSQMELVRLNYRNFTDLLEYLLEAQLMTGQRSEVCAELLVLWPSGLDQMMLAAQRVEDKFSLLLQAGPSHGGKGSGPTRPSSAAQAIAQIAQARAIFAIPTRPLLSSPAAYAVQPTKSAAHPFRSATSF